MFRRSMANVMMLLALFGLNCEREREPVKTTPELESLVKLFSIECTKRGLHVDLSPKFVLVSFGRLDSNAGSCKPNSHPKIITIDSLMWRVLSPHAKEMLVFHELAHCLLEKKHNNDVLKHGECKSWMRENDSVCVVNTVNAAWRAYYINELFSERQEPEPAWYDMAESTGINDTSIVPDKIIKTQSTLVFDSSFFNDQNEWLIKINITGPTRLIGSIGVAINEYAIQLSSQYESPNTISRVLMLRQYATNKNMLSRDVIEIQHHKTDVSIKRRGHVIFVFFEKDLKLCMPFSNGKLKISGYADLKTEKAVSITVYRPDSPKTPTP